MSTTSRLVQIRQARGFGQRLFGLMGCARPVDGAEGRQALLLTHCTSVHTCFMRYALDIAYLDAQGRIVRLRPALPPWRCSWAGLQARDAVHVLEMSSGAIASLALQTGLQLHPWPLHCGGNGPALTSACFVPNGHAGNASATTAPATGENTTLN